MIEPEDKLDDTLDPTNNEDQNTEPDLSDSNTELDTDNQDDSSGSTDDDISSLEDKDIDLDSLDDDQFTEFLETGKISKKIENKKSTIKEKTITESTDSDTKVDDNKSKKPNVDTSDIDTSKVDYENIYKDIFKGFKANGKEIKPKTAEDVISLMQMGANYTKKMQSLAPMRKIVESLNKAEINESNLNFLIDVYKGDKEAIKKLLDIHKVDPLDINLDETNYVPKNNMVSNEDIEYSEVLDEVQSSIPKIQEIMSSKWDEKSRQALLKDPKLLIALHQEIELGRFDEVQSKLELEKTFGRYKNKSDIEAYSDLVTKMVSEQTIKQSTVTTINKPNTPKREIPDKKGAAPNKAKKAVAQNSNVSKVDLFNMSEEEFNKLSMRDLV